MQYNDIFEYPVLSEEEIDAQNEILKPGIYDFEVLKVSLKVSKTSGQPMLELNLRIWDENGRTYSLLDWFTTSPKMAFKIKHFWESVGEPEKYNGSSRPQDFIGKTGKVITKIRKNNENKDQPNIYDYFVDKNRTNKSESKLDFDDEIPF